jgi:carbonic anhydrase/acetyltransferase-like protein (isoleucine patch superfamily)
MPIYQLGTRTPQIHPSAYIAATAVIIGDVTIGEDVSVWDHVVIRGDNAPITIGRASNIQEGVVLHTDEDYPLSIGHEVTVGHQAMLHGCTIHDGVLIGIQAIVLNGAVIESQSLIGAAALVAEHKQVASGSLMVGTPAKLVRTLTENEQGQLRQSAIRYAEKAQYYKTALRQIDL